MSAEDLYWSSTLAVLGGIANGSYMVFIKRPAVLRAGVHPLVFQALKTAAAALYGVALLFARLCFHGGELHLNWLGVASACLWVPAGLCNIACVPLAGVGACAVASSCVASISSFGIGLYRGETVRSHPLLDSTVYFAPVYILGVCAGMVALVVAPYWASGLAGRSATGPALSPNAHKGSRFRVCNAPKPLHRLAVMAPPTPNTESTELLHKAFKEEVADHSDMSVFDRSPLASPRAPHFHGCGVLELEAGGFGTGGPAGARRRMLVGYGLACVAGGFASAMYTIVAIAKGRAHSPAAHESLNPLGSWAVSFGLGAVLGTAVAAAAIAFAYRLVGWHMPPLRWSAAFAPGVAAGAVWTVGNVFTTLAVSRGGNAVAMAQNQATNLVTAGLWGLLLYQEHRGRAAMAWAASALFTVAMVVLLSFEKATL